MILNEKDFFNDIDPEVMEKITAIYSKEEYPKDTVLFKKGEDAKSIFILKGGTINLVIANGGTFIIPLKNPGEIFGLSGLVERSTYTAAGVCATDAKVIRIDRDQLDEIFDQHPHAGLILVRRLGKVLSKKLSRLYRDFFSYSWSEPL